MWSRITLGPGCNLEILVSGGLRQGLLDIGTVADGW